MCDVFINKRAPGGRHRGAPEGRQEKSVGRPFHMCVLSLRAAAVRVTHHHQQPTRLPICVASFAEQTARSFAIKKTGSLGAHWPLPRQGLAAISMLVSLVQHKKVWSDQKSFCVLQSRMAPATSDLKLLPSRNISEIRLVERCNMSLFDVSIALGAMTSRLGNYTLVLRG
eukprot:SAG25_NODE_1018_length_4280_cov_2.698158_3_plen_170_part_00